MPTRKWDTCELAVGNHPGIPKAFSIRTTALALAKETEEDIEVGDINTLVIRLKHKIWAPSL